MIFLRRVVGESMLPTLAPERLVIAVRLLRVRPGDIALIHHEGREKIKRVHNIEDGQVFVLGDNASASTDSRNFGWLPRETVIAKVIWPRR